MKVAGGEAVAVPADVADPGEVEGAATFVEEELGPIDVWVNSAMATIFAPLQMITPEEYKRATDVTYLGLRLGDDGGAPADGPARPGVVVQVGSALAYRGIPLQAPHYGAKHAIQGFQTA